MRIVTITNYEHENEMSKLGPTLADWGELRFLEWVRRAAGIGTGEVAVSIGDDAAVLKLAGREAVVTTDALIENVHFKREWISPRDLGAKSLAVNLSDIAAMAARPVAAFLSLGVPPETPIRALKDFFAGLIGEGRRYGCALAGGDLVRARDWTINLMVIGAPAVAGRVARRSAAKPGQRLYVTGWPGESAAGLEALRRGEGARGLIGRHLRPTPRLAEGVALARACPDLAMLDVSDGVWNDAGQMARASGVAIEIDAGALPVSRELAMYAKRIAADAPGFVLFGGEDYELLFATRESLQGVQAAFTRAGLKTRVSEIGRVKPGRKVRVLDPAGRPLAIKDRTFRHF